MPRYSVEYEYKVKEWGQMEGVIANNEFDATEQVRKEIEDFGEGISDVVITNVEEIVD